MTDLQAAAERWKKGYMQLCDYTGAAYPNPEYERDAKTLANAYLAVLADPTVLLKPPEWEATCWGADSQQWIVLGLHYTAAYSSTINRWMARCGTLPLCSPCDSLSAAQAACEADFRERIRGAFQETKTAPGA